MKILFAVSNENVSNKIVDSYQKNMERQFHIRTYFTLMQ